MEIKSALRSQEINPKPRRVYDHNLGEISFQFKSQWTQFSLVVKEAGNQRDCGT